MIAGKVTLGNTTVRVHANTAAVGRLAAAATLGMAGRAGDSEATRFTYDVVDCRDRERWKRAVAQASRDEHVAALAEMVSLILARMEADPDPDNREWARLVSGAWDRFRAGDRHAFEELAMRMAVKWAS